MSTIDGAGLREALPLAQMACRTDRCEPARRGLGWLAGYVSSPATSIAGSPATNAGQALVPPQVIGGQTFPVGTDRLIRPGRGSGAGMSSGWAA